MVFDPSTECVQMFVECHLILCNCGVCQFKTVKSVY